MTSRTKPGVAFWATVVVVVVLVGYPASLIGILLPVRAKLLPEAVLPLIEIIYAPLKWLISRFILH